MYQGLLVNGIPRPERLSAHSQRGELSKVSRADSRTRKDMSLQFQALHFVLSFFPSNFTKVKALRLGGISMIAYLDELLPFVFKPRLGLLFLNPKDLAWNLPGFCQSGRTTFSGSILLSLGRVVEFCCVASKEEWLKG